MANDDTPTEVEPDDAERATVIKRVADALEDQEAGEAPTITMASQAADTAPLPPRRGS